MKADAKAIKWACKLVWNEGTDSCKARLKPRNAPMATRAEKAIVAKAMDKASRLHRVTVPRIRGRDSTPAVVDARRAAWALAADAGMNPERIAVVCDRSATTVRHGIRAIKSTGCFHSDAYGDLSEDHDDIIEMFEGSGIL